jgi:hypothetical protein
MIPRRDLIVWGVLLLLAVVLTVETHDYTILIVGLLLFLVSAFVFWQRTRRGSR